MSKIEEEIEDLCARLTALSERVRLRATAERFIASDHQIRSGDYARFQDGHVTRVSINQHDGRWNFTNRNGSHVEAFRVPPEEGIERLYTIQEVGEILISPGSSKPDESLDGIVAELRSRAVDHDPQVFEYVVIAKLLEQAKTIELLDDLLNAELRGGASSVLR